MLINRTMSWDFLVFFCCFHENKRKESWEAVTGWGRVPLILSISNDAQLASCMNFGHQFLTLFVSWFLLYSSWMTFNHFNFDLTSRLLLSCEWEERKWRDPQGNGFSKSPRIAECWQFFLLTLWGTSALDCFKILLCSSQEGLSQSYHSCFI